MKKNIGSYPVRVQAPWKLKKVVSPDEKFAKILLLPFAFVFHHIFRYWMEEMVEFVMKGGGNRQGVWLIDVTEENYPINNANAYVEKKILGEDYALVCEHLFRNREISVGDEIELYWDTEIQKFIFKLIKKCHVL
uniref:TF-B3 domain-containing protein n=1 Tax=Solanum lycopersicum TaxID=4081 RepID=A0A3Q7HK60_SOLLC